MPLAIATVVTDFASATGRGQNELAEIAAVKTATGTMIPRFVKNRRSFSTARCTRRCAARFVHFKATATSRRLLSLKNRRITASRSFLSSRDIASSSSGAS